MSSTSLYADTFNAYTNSDNISNVLQNKVDNVAQNEVLFGSVDYSAGYNSILSDYNSSIGNLENGSNDEDVPGSDSQDVGNENGESGGTSSSAGLSSPSGSYGLFRSVPNIFAIPCQNPAAAPPR